MDGMIDASLVLTRMDKLREDIKYDIREIKSDLSKDIGGLKKSVDELEARVRAFEGSPKTTDLKAMLDELKKEHKEAIEKIEKNHERDLKELEECVSKAQTEIATLDRKVIWYIAMATGAGATLSFVISLVMWYYSR